MRATPSGLQLALVAAALFATMTATVVMANSPHAASPATPEVEPVGASQFAAEWAALPEEERAAIVARAEADDVHRTQGVPLRNVQGLTDYGNWCGGGHGGFQDCCNGKPCPACNYDATTVSKECLEQCPPVDALDAQCAQHDRCCFLNQLGSLSCSPQGNRCACDCKLIAGAEAAECGLLNVQCHLYKAALIETFEHVLSCFYYGATPQYDMSACHMVPCSGGECNSCVGAKMCNGALTGLYSVNDFCTGPFPTPG